MVQEIPPGTRDPHIPGKRPVKRIKDGVQGNHDDTEHDPPGIEREAGKYRYEERRKGEPVRGEPDTPGEVYHGLNDALHVRPELVKCHVPKPR